MGNSETFNADLAKVLETALNLVTGDRAEQHGDAYDQCDLAAQFWSTYLAGRGFIDPRNALAPVDVSQMMLLLKVSRDVLGAFNCDTFVDQAGYSALSYAIKNRMNDED